MTAIRVPALNERVIARVRSRQDSLTKPRGSLGRLEDLASRLAAVTGCLDPPLKNRVLFLLAGDHGVAAEGVSAYPTEVTAQMVRNFRNGGAAANVLARQLGVRVEVADFGVGQGTRSFTEGPAMAVSQARRAIRRGRDLVRGQRIAGLDVVLTGEMGIGNSTSAAALTCALTGVQPKLAVGRGTGVGEAGLRRKRAVVRRGLEVNRESLHDPLQVLAALGGFEIAGLVGVILEGARLRKPVLLDGFIASAAALVAVQLNPESAGCLIAAHRSAERGHRLVLEALGLKPLLDLEMRLGEGTGALLALPLLEASIRLLNEMSTFEEAAVANRLADG